MAIHFLSSLCPPGSAVDRANHVAPLSVERNATTVEQLDPELPLANTIITPGPA